MLVITMGKPYTVTSGRTFSQTVRGTVGTLVGWGVLACVGYGAWHFGNAYVQERPYLQREERIKDAIQSKDADRAEALLKDFHTQGLLKPDQERDLQLTIDDLHKRQYHDQVGQKLEALLTAQDLPGAETFVQQLAASGEYTTGDIIQYRAKMAEFSEDGLFQAIQRTPKDRQTSIDRYLALYPKGQNRQTVLQYDFIDNLSALIGNFTHKGDFDKTYAQLVKLNALCDHYGEPNPSLSRLFSLTDITNAADTYAAKYVRTSADPIAIGSTVQIVPLADVNFDTDFVAERNTNFPPGTIGTVVNITTNDHSSFYFVRCEDIKTVHWSKDWNLKEYWGNGQNVGKYALQELRFVTPLTVTERTQFQFESQRLSSSLQKLLAPTLVANPSPEALQ